MTTITTIILLIGAVGIGIYLFKSINSEKARLAQEQSNAPWDTVIAQSPDSGRRILLGAARPFSRLPSVYDESNVTLHRVIQQKLLAAGGMYGSSVEIFMSIQALGLIIGGAAIALGLAGIITPVLGAAIAVFAIVLPYGQVDSKARKRTREIGQRLPEFAELLQMPLTAGLSVLAALEFTSQRSEGIVANEVANMLLLIRTQSLTEAESFMYAGERLGTSESRAFFNSLAQAYLEGSKVIESLASQSQQLRTAAFQQQRSANKKVPVKLVFVFGLHLMPLLFILAMIPLITSLSKV